MRVNKKIPKIYYVSYTTLSTLKALSFIPNLKLKKQALGLAIFVIPSRPILHPFCFLLWEVDYIIGFLWPCVSVGFGLLRALVEEDRKVGGGVYVYFPSSFPTRSPQSDNILQHLIYSQTEGFPQSPLSLALSIFLSPYLFKPTGDN